MDKNKIVDEFATIATDNIVEKPRDTNMRVKGATLMSATSCYAAPSESANTPDDRKSDRGSSIHKKYSNLEKACVIEKHENAYGNLTVSEWVCQMNAGRDHEKCLGKSKTGWKK